eukprot:CAMPEP_0175730048 /NCGR_PEP_ID=MMETSP0097-20121207/50119_1 /TAXON_ID=311494 /ORGANISM="Alexandrium monilatum, Strain CCMP3105" /LENGTH=68 /DNA_ID=CAMNT_0017037931 /DNA_START=68 /DNA_END=271 /DNA_ORIENTATION=-
MTLHRSAFAIADGGLAEAFRCKGRREGLCSFRHPGVPRSWAGPGAERQGRSARAGSPLAPWKMCAARA